VIEGAFDTPSSLRSLECRSTLCRVEVQHTDVEAHKRFVERAILSPGKRWEGLMMATLGEGSGEGGFTSVAFFARVGTELVRDSELSAEGSSQL
jgi:hypothetical protein